ncbi:MAG: ABC transporter ATP-binding protein/permease [Yaniella sp.]|uniref:ABC transporter ATP-binding protein n=2 Tax=Yaniella sp. TaxID=2773929 RepID=UPI002649EA92|nr:ABC transporter ATP-binding protein [Yaniella sp.]MDN5703766.1 ABC transporter ATP-binding protein/permease [Yaniella sp.]MDN5731229.1 ABC transporter ATP-binding protein/permease [Yaniella sp.]MDN5814818.1 ABC transporter ATP-binding protein/permease [Yaniella sp.]MDN5818402.1 ABC transporter ATP-binding protein/permease [Yaniella sp.]MDN5838506.1 ABC transporter ATP-binding protein/permease [Yaniella sp.]
MSDTSPEDVELAEGTDPGRTAKAFWPSALRLLRVFAPYKLQLITAVILSIVSVVLQVWAPLILGEAVNVLFHSDGIDFARLGELITRVLAMYVVAMALMWLQGRILVIIGVRITYLLRQDVERKIHRVPSNWFDSTQRGDLLSRTTNDVDNIQNALQQTVSSLLNGLLTIIGITIMMFAISWRLALIALIAVPIAAVVVGVIGKRAQKLFSAQWANTGRLNGHVEEAFTGHDVVTLFNRQEAMNEEFAARNDAVYQASYKAQFISGMIHPIMQWVTYLGYVGIAVVGALQVAAGALALGSVTAFIQYSREFNQPLGQLAGLANMIISAVASAERVFEFLDAEEEDDTEGELAEVAGAVEFQNVAFGYGETPLITNLNLRVEPGQLVAIVGPTGAGKTTLINLLMRFYDVDAGRILLDGTDISTVSRAELRQPIGMVLQDAVLFSGSIKHNIAYGRPEATDEQIIAAAQAARADHFINQLPDGYGTEISLDADAISAGERQLLTIARAFLSDPRLLILDEATSSVDTRTEALIQEALAKLQQGRTSFVIAHRLSTIRAADVIVVMDHGDVVEQGTHAQLLQAGGMYHDLYTAQTQHDLEGGR